jgi:hypothetical protein
MKAKTRFSSRLLLLHQEKKRNFISRSGNQANPVGGGGEGGRYYRNSDTLLKGLGHEIKFKFFDKNEKF